MIFFFFFFEKTLLIIPDLSLLLKKCIQTLKSDIHLSIFFNFIIPFEFFVKSYQNFQNTPVFIFFLKKL
jgi:hypothetical protein